ncbi:MAG: outer membrane beta-barrel protein [Bacteroidota bacterium]
MNKKIVFLLLILLIPLLSSAQRWKRMRYEFAFGLGASNFLGELGGADQIGTDYFRDIEISMTRPVLSVGVRYKINKWLAGKTNLTYARISGNDKLTTEESRNYRNLSFRSDIIEFSVQIEPAVIKEQAGHRYRLKGVKGRKWKMVNTYPFIGVAVFYFNPKADYQGKWHSLRPLCTEGQGFFPTRKKYSLIQISVPVGIGFKYGYNRRWGVSLEYGIRKTFTDYIDDVSTTYISEQYFYTEFDEEKSNLAAALADQSDDSKPQKTAAGQQRGDPSDNDSYMFAIFSLNYKFTWKKRRRSRPKF